MDKAESALAEAEREHEEIGAAIAKEISSAQRRAEGEDARWKTLKERFKADLRKAGRLGTP